MQHAAITADRPRELSDLRPGDPVFWINTTGRQPLVKLGRVTGLHLGTIQVQDEQTSVSQIGGPRAFYADSGRLVGGGKDVKIALEVPTGARIIGGSLLAKVAA